MSAAVRRAEAERAAAARVAAAERAQVQKQADAAIEEVDAAREAPEDPINAARLLLEQELRGAVAMKRGLGAPVAPRQVAILEAAIAQAVAAGVGGEQLRNARERLEDCREEAAVEAAEYALIMSMRRANMASFGRAQLSDLVTALGAATAAGADPAVVRSAGKLIAKRGSAEEAQLVKLYERLERFKRMAELSSSAGERENAERMIEQAQQKVAALLEPRSDAEAGKEVEDE
jgi:hypothetical protein